MEVNVPAVGREYANTLTQKFTNPVRRILQFI